MNDYPLGLEEFYLEHTGWIVGPQSDLVIEYLREGWFEYAERAFFWQYLRRDSNFLDVGAHIGLHSANARRVAKSGQIVCVEPNSQLHPYLEHNVSDLTLISKAVSDFSGVACFNSLEEGQSSFGHIARDTEATEQSLSSNVNVVTLDAMMAELAPFSPDLIKVDVEGDEERFLTGGEEFLKGFEGTLILEFAKANLEDAGSSSQALERLVREQGFSIATYDPIMCQLTHAELVHPVWYENYFLTRNIDGVNRRLSQCSKSQSKIAQDIASKGLLAKRLLSERDHSHKQAAELEHLFRHVVGLVNYIDSGGGNPFSKSRKRPSSDIVTELQGQFGELRGRIEYLSPRFRAQSQRIQAFNRCMEETASEFVEIAELLEADGQSVVSDDLSSIHPDFKEDTELFRSAWQRVRNLIISTAQIRRENEQRMAELADELEIRTEELNVSTSKLSSAGKQLSLVEARNLEAREAQGALIEKQTALEKDFELVKAELAGYESKEVEWEIESKELRHDRAQLVSSQAEMNEQLSDMTSRFQKATQELADCEFSIEKLERELLSRDAAIKSIEKEHSQRLHDLEGRLTDATQASIELEEKLIKAEQQVLDLNRELETQIEESKEEALGLLSKLQKASDEIEAQQSKYDLLTQQLDEAHYQYRELDQIRVASEKALRERNAYSSRLLSNAINDLLEVKKSRLLRLIPKSRLEHQLDKMLRNLSS